MHTMLSQVIRSCKGNALFTHVFSVKTQFVSFVMGYLLAKNYTLCFANLGAVKFHCLMIF